MLSWKLSSTLPAMISIGLNPSASKNVLAATVRDIAEGIRTAAPLKVASKCVTSCGCAMEHLTRTSCAILVPREILS